MRRRVVRDLGTLLGVVVILVCVILLQDYFSRGGLTEVMNAQRVKEETKQKEKGVKVVDWELLRKTKGTRSKGPTFAKEVLAMKDQPASFVGFMTPLYEFRGVKEFILLPLPIQCYFCQSPPMREVVLVQMAVDKKTDIVSEPVLFTGKLTLNEGPGTKFFYVLKDAIAGTDMSMLQKKVPGAQHMIESEAQRKSQSGAQESLLPGQEAPKPGVTPPAPIPMAPDNSTAPGGQTPVPSTAVPGTSVTPTPPPVEPPK